MIRASLTTFIFLTFTVYSLGVVEQHGFLSAFEIALAGGWSTQVFLDLCLALIVSAAWMRHDAQRKQLVWWPFALASVPLGSVAVLAYASLSAWASVRRDQEMRPGALSV